MFKLLTSLFWTRTVDTAQAFADSDAGALLDRQIRDAIVEIRVVKRALSLAVVHNEGDNFSVGANIGLALFAANIAMWPMIDDLIWWTQALKSARAP